MARKQLVAGIDIGSNKICACIGEWDGERVEVLGVGLEASRGLRKGAVANLSETIDSVKKAVAKATKQSNLDFKSAWVNVGGSFHRSINREAKTSVTSKSGQVTAEDVGRLLSEVGAVDHGPEYEILHTLVQEFELDGQNELQNPVGLCGSSLTLRAHLVLNSSAVLQNLTNAVHRSGVLVNARVMNQLASAYAVLSDDEKQFGTVVLDIGGSTTDIAVFFQNAIWHSEVLMMGGSQITRDIAIGLKAPMVEAENAKRKFGHVFPDQVPAEEYVELPEVGLTRQKSITRSFLCQIVEARCEEMFEMAGQVVSRVGINPDLISGAVLTGGGALMEGIAKKAEDVLGMPTRVGYPINLHVGNKDYFNPTFATAFGLLCYGAESLKGRTEQFRPSPAQKSSEGVLKKVTDWFLKKA